MVICHDGVEPFSGHSLNLSQPIQSGIVVKIGVLRAGKLINVLPDYDVTATHYNTAAWLIYPSRAYVPLKVKVFSEFLKQHLGT